MAGDVWDMTAVERAALVEDLAGRQESDFERASLNEGWTVLDTLGHINATASMTKGGFFKGLIRAGFNFKKMTATGMNVQVKGGPAAAVDRLRSLISARTGPPGPADSWLGEALIHGEDIRRPLEISRDYPTPALLRVADFYKKSNLIVGAKKRIAGLHLKATDADWQHGEGPEVSGPLINLILAMTGRPAGADGLTGQGADILGARCRGLPA
ncbi:MAG: maleylpyruvate isomerase family mycothiol-dependent enzyme [Acidimicrobiales bacterium]